jgi:hypothetical protein
MNNNPTKMPTNVNSILYSISKSEHSSQQTQEKELKTTAATNGRPETRIVMKFFINTTSKTIVCTRGFL